MPVAYRTIFSGGATSGTSDRTLAFTPAIGDALIAIGAFSANTLATPALTDNQGGTWDVVATALKNTSGDIMWAAVRTAVVTSAVSHTLTMATGSNTAGVYAVIAVTGALSFGRNLVRQVKAVPNTAAGNTPVLNFDIACLSSNMTIVAASNAANTATLTEPTLWTERLDAGQSTPALGLEIATRDSGFSSTNVTWGGSSATAFAAIGLELTNDLVVTATGQPVATIAGTTTVSRTISAAGSVVTTNAGSVTATLIPSATHRRGGYGASTFGRAAYGATLDEVVNPNVSVNATGVSVSILVGTLRFDRNLSAVGQALSALAGTVRFDRTLPLTGQSLSALTGTVSIGINGAVSITATGIAVGVVAGTTRFDRALPVTGRVVSVSAGSAVYGLQMTPTGIQVATLAGTVTISTENGIPGYSLLPLFF